MPQNPANQEVQIFIFNLRTLVKLPRPLRVSMSKKLPSTWTVSLYRSNVCRSVVTTVEVTAAQVRQWAWMQGSWPRKSGESLLHMFKNSESNAELKGLDVECLVIEHIKWIKLPRCSTGLRQLLVRSAHTRVLPATWRWSLLKKSRLFLNQKRRLHKRKRYPRRNWWDENVQPGNKCCRKINADKVKKWKISPHFALLL